MKWINLRKNKCPKCKDDLFQKENDKGFISCLSCDFRISERKMAEICFKEIKTINFIEDNLSKLNNI